MRQEQEVPSNTTEAIARSLGATITWFKYHAKAHNFPTRKAAEMFADILKEKNYGYSIHCKGDEGTSIHYHAPQVYGNVTTLQSQRKEKQA